MAIFHSYVKLPEGKCFGSPNKVDKLVGIEFQEKKKRFWEGAIYYFRDGSNLHLKLSQGTTSHRADTDKYALASVII